MSSVKTVYSQIIVLKRFPQVYMISSEMKATSAPMLRVAGNIKTHVWLQTGWKEHCIPSCIRLMMRKGIRRTLRWIRTKDCENTIDESEVLRPDVQALQKRPVFAPYIFDLRVEMNICKYAHSEARRSG